MKVVILFLAGILPLVPGIFLLVQRHRQPSTQLTRKLVLSMGGLNILIAFMVVGLGVMWLLAPETAAAAGLTQDTAGDSYRSISAAIAVSVGSIGAAYAVSTTGSAAVGAIAEKPEIFGRALIFVGLAEGVAIYGLIIAFIILGG
jgi:V/A-type H+-transporting ATPase subunit K